MEALVERLSQLDSQAEGAVRVVMFYDRLMRRRVDLPALARASAGLAECVAGIRIHGSGRVIRASHDGSQTPVPLPPPSTTVPITLDEEEIGTAWLERPGPPGALDELLLDRLAIAAAAVVERYGPARVTMADPALVELVISSGADEAARTRALRLLGFAVGLPVQVAAVRSELPLDQVGGLVCPARLVKAAALADLGVILATTVDPDRFPAGVCAGIRTACTSSPPGWPPATAPWWQKTSTWPVCCATGDWPGASATPGSARCAASWHTRPPGTAGASWWLAGSTRHRRRARAAGQ
jgi:hypothetical protein